jgi:F-type H+-transporting ATPase subunit delta
MIKDEIVVKRYADAFIGFAKETIGLDRALQELKDIKFSIINDNPEFLQLLESLEITNSEKNDFIDTIVRDGFSEEIRQFLKYLLEKGRINKLIDIMEYIRVTYSFRGEEEVLLKVSSPLDLETIKQIEDELEKKFQRKFKFYIDLDGDLLGGVSVTIGNTIIDGSIKRRLEDLKEKLMTLKV